MLWKLVTVMYHRLTQASTRSKLLIRTLLRVSSPLTGLIEVCVDVHNSSYPPTVRLSQ